MKTIFNNDGIILKPEDGRDRVFMRDVLKVEQGKVFCKVLVPKEAGGDHAVLITAFDPNRKTYEEI